MTTGFDPLARCFDTDQANRFVVDEACEDAHRVRAAADTGDDGIGKLAGLLEHLRPRLLTDDRLKVAHDNRVRVRPRYRTDAVVRGPHVGDPIAERFVHRVLQRRGAGRDRVHLGAQQLHPSHVGCLATDVFRPHVDFAGQPHQRARRRGRHAMLTGSRLGDDPSLSHPLRQQNLAKRVVHLVGAGVTEVLTLEPDPAPNLRRQPGREVRGGLAPSVLVEERIELRLKRRITLRFLVRLRQLVERGHEGLGDIASAVRTVAPGSRFGGLHEARNVAHRRAWCMHMNEAAKAILPPFDRQAFERSIRRTAFLNQWFQPTIEGAENIPAEGGALLVTNHGNFGLDLAVLIGIIHERTGRVLRSLGDRVVFATPFFRDLARDMGIIEGEPEATVALLEDDQLVLVYPGGAKEALSAPGRRIPPAVGGQPRLHPHSAARPEADHPGGWHRQRGALRPSRLEGPGPGKPRRPLRLRAPRREVRDADLHGPWHAPIPNRAALHHRRADPPAVRSGSRRGRRDRRRAPPSRSPRATQQLIYRGLDQREQQAQNSPDRWHWHWHWHGLALALAWHWHWHWHWH